MNAVDVEKKVITEEDVAKLWEAFQFLSAIRHRQPQVQPVQ